jgi:DNA-binding CsgD family transcriptional regulator
MSVEQLAQIAEKIATEAELTPREVEIWMLRVAGLNLHDSATRLGIAYSTAWAHYNKARQRILARQAEVEAEQDDQRGNEEWLCHTAIPNLARTSPPTPHYQITGYVKAGNGEMLPQGDVMPAHAGAPVGPEDLRQPGRWRWWQNRIEQYLATHERPPVSKPKPKKSRRERRAEKRQKQAQS